MPTTTVFKQGRTVLGGRQAGRGERETTLRNTLNRPRGKELVHGRLAPGASGRYSELLLLRYTRIYVCGES